MSTLEKLIEEKDCLAAKFQLSQQRLQDALKEFVLNKIVNPVNTGVVESACTSLLRLHVRPGFYNDVEVYFELGFQSGEGKTDFGSDSYFEYTSKGLSINHGTIGSWTKENKYQIFRIQLLNYICTNISTLESGLQTILDEHKSHVRDREALWEARQAVETEERRIEMATADAKLAAIQVGTVLCYPETTSTASRLFSTAIWIKSDDEWEVSKMGEKTFTLISKKTGAVRRLSKIDVRTHMTDKGLKIVNK